MEHRLFGADTDSCRKYKSGPRTWQWNAIERVPAPDTLLGPEGSGISSPSGRLTALDLHYGRTTARCCCTATSGRRRDE